MVDLSLRFAGDYEMEDYATTNRKVYSRDEIRTLSDIWQPAAYVEQTMMGAIFELPSGLRFRVTRDFLSEPGEVDHDWLRAFMRHIERQWNGSGRIPAQFQRPGHIDPEKRLWERAYAEVFGVELRDTGQMDLGPRLSEDTLKTLPDRRKQVRELHPDAPPARPNEVGHLKSLYCERYPFAGPHMLVY